MLRMINFKDLSKINDKKLLKLTKRAYQLADEEEVSKVALNYFVNEVSKRHYGIEDVNEATWIREYLCFSNDNLIKIVKDATAFKFIKKGIVGDCIIPISSIKSIQDDGNGNILIFA